MFSPPRVIVPGPKAPMVEVVVCPGSQYSTLPGFAVAEPPQLFAVCALFSPMLQAL